MSSVTSHTDFKKKIVCPGQYSAAYKYITVTWKEKVTLQVFKLGKKQINMTSNTSQQKRKRGKNLT